MLRRKRRFFRVFVSPRCEAPEWCCSGGGDKGGGGGRSAGIIAVVSRCGMRGKALPSSVEVFLLFIDAAAAAPAVIDDDLDERVDTGGDDEADDDNEHDVDDVDVDVAAAAPAAAAAAGGGAPAAAAAAGLTTATASSVTHWSLSSPGGEDSVAANDEHPTEWIKPNHWQWSQCPS